MITKKEVSCIYEDILYVDAYTTYFGKPIKVVGSKVYELVASDQVAVNCTGYDGLVLKIHTVGVGKPLSVIK